MTILEETGFLPSRKFSDGKEIYDYIQRIADQFDLHEKGLFHTRVTSIVWDDVGQRWQVGSNRGDAIRARFVIMCGGTLRTPKFPAIPGLHSFKGHMFHTSRWDYGYTGGGWDDPALDKLRDKRVAILGTGATAIQAIPHLGRYAKELHVLQRTPSSVDERPNPPTYPTWAAALQPGWQAKRQDTLEAGLHSYAFAVKRGGVRALRRPFVSTRGRKARRLGRCSSVAASDGSFTPPLPDRA